MSTRSRGDAARVVKDGRQIGNLYRWQFAGELGGEWEASANRYKLCEPPEGDVEVSFFVGRNELHAVGRFADEVTADGTTKREPVRLAGSDVEFR